MNDLLKSQFDAVAQSYDLQRRQLIPCFDDFYGAAVSWMNTEIGTPRILDLGAGTGLFSSFAKQRYPNAKFTLVDISEKMLKMARQRFGNDPNVQYIAADYCNYPFTEQYDIILSSLSIHHLTHPDKSTLFQKIFNLLPQGGIFINADQAAGLSSYFDNRYKEHWEEDVRKSGLAEQAIEASILRRKQDINATVEDQLKWLRAAGFTEVNVVFSYNEFTVFFALK
ncbi:class I SAM-dependent methyltransferase [Paenibacillus sp. NPDC057934]|uniref:class I SAM-dependent methyltransferase n=1 Tax=Paenibacillus sp. NPDC057934 TaxID=3346282 RepID=UPI0036DD4F7B